MSRPTTSQIIASGDYLQPDFDAKTLTIPHLIGIFAYHQVPYPAQHNKAKLIEVFDKEIKKRGASLLKQRLERQETLASEDGIVDGVTGVPIAPAQPAPVRRSSRRISRGASAEPTYAEPVATKRRRASAEPSIGRTTRKSSVKPAPAAISEESEEEVEVKPEPSPEPLPVSKVSKRKESEAAGPSSRRISQTFGPGTDDSGWEDNNVFQSGAESSPVRPSRKKASSRKSLADFEPKSPKSPAQSSRVPDMSPSKSTFSPILPSILTNPRPRMSITKSADDYIDDMSGLADVSAQMVVDDDDDDDDDENGLILPNEQDTAQEDVQTRERAEKILAKKDALRSKQPKSSILQRIIISLLVFVAAGLAGQFKTESKPIGYCDTGSDTNKALANLRDQRTKIQACYAENAGNETAASCPPLPLVPLSHPDSCTPCPAHGKCTAYEMICGEGYVLSPHPLSRIPYISVIFDGMPGFGPIAFPPKCVDDEELKKNIGRAGKWIDSLLSEIRGMRICAGVDTRKKLEGGEAELWGLNVNDLYNMYMKKFPREGENSVDRISKSFWEAIEKLRQYGHLIETKDSNGRTYVASDHAEMNLSCRATVQLRESWVAWRSKFFGLIMVIALGFYGKIKVTARRGENQRVAELVQIALETLQEQELNHISDPATYPQPYLSSLQLRDLILQDEHSIPARSRIWNKVERVVEGNTNVRTNMEELRGGEEARAWRWVGSSGLSSPKKRLSMFMGQTQSPS